MLHNIGVQMQLHVCVIYDFAQHSECDGTLSGNPVQCCGRPPDSLFTAFSWLASAFPLSSICQVSWLFSCISSFALSFLCFIPLPWPATGSVHLCAHPTTCLLLACYDFLPNPSVTYIIQSFLPRTYCSLMTLEMETVSSSETLMTNYQ